MHASHCRSTSIIPFLNASHKVTLIDGNPLPEICSCMQGKALGDSCLWSEVGCSRGWMLALPTYCADTAHWCCGRCAQSRASKLLWYRHAGGVEH
jgi:hypothetical protein